MSHAHDDDAPDAFEGPAGEVDQAAALAFEARLRAEGSPEFAPELALDEAAALGCIRCGSSCRSVYLWQGDLALFKERETRKWVEHHAIETFSARQPDGRVFWGVKLPTPCQHLLETAPGQFGCAIYDRRPYVCRVYRGLNPDGPQPGCGFNRRPPGATPSA